MSDMSFPWVVLSGSHLMFWGRFRVLDPADNVSFLDGSAMTSAFLALLSNITAAMQMSKFLADCNTLASGCRIFHHASTYTDLMHSWSKTLEENNVPGAKNDQCILCPTWIPNRTRLE